MIIFDPSTPWTVDPDDFKSLSRNTPFAGWELKARPLITICGGRKTFDEIAHFRSNENVETLKALHI
jgi:dihydroorotase